MTSLRRLALVAFVLYAFVILSRILFLNPSLLVFHPTTKDDGPARMFPQMTMRNDSLLTASSEAATFIYRENRQRTGVHEASVLPWPLQRQWTSAPLNVGIHGASKSSPAVDASGVYVGSDSSWFYAFDHGSNLKWKYFVANSVRGIHGTAALDADHVYFGGYNGFLYCLRKADGRLVWRTGLAHAIGSSPVVDGDFIYSTAETGSFPNGYLAKLNRHTGEIIWQTEWIGEQVHSSPALDESLETLFYGANNGALASIRAKDGLRLWQQNLGGAVKGTPVVLGNEVYVASWAEKLFSLDKLTGQIKWTAPLGGLSQSSPTYVPDLDIFVVNAAKKGAGQVTAVARKTGGVLWARPGLARRDLMSSGIAVRSSIKGPFYVWIPCEDRSLCALNPKNGQMLQKIELERSISGMPTIFGDALYVSLEDGGLIQFKPVQRASSK